MLVILQNQSYMSYHEKISTKQIPTCEKTVKEDNQDTPAVRICINMQQKIWEDAPGKQKLLKSDASPL